MPTHAIAPTIGPDLRSSGCVAIVSSAGGIKALIELMSHLPANFPLPIFVAQHLARSAPSILPDILHWHSRLNCKWATAGDLPQSGTVYVVPPTSSLAVRSEGFVVSELGPNPSEWLASPDVLLHSLVNLYGAGTVAVTLSGMIPVGLEGLRAVRAAGGFTMAQSEASSAHFEMPCAAVDFGKADAVFPPNRIAEALVSFAKYRQASLVRAE